MGAFTVLIDALLFFFFLIIAVAAPLIDGQTCLPPTMFPDALVNLKQWYAHQYGDYLVHEKPHFFVGLVWIEMLLQWPLALFNLYGILASKPWFNTTCLIYGASVFTSMGAIIGELKGSGKATEKLMMFYYPFMGIGVLAILRGLFPQSSRDASLIIGKRHILPRKKRV